MPAGEGGATQGRQSAAAAQLLRRFQLLRKSPRSFAFLCDELTHAVERGTLSRPLLEQLSGFAVLEVGKFVPERKYEEATLKVGPQRPSPPLPIKVSIKAP